MSISSKLRVLQESRATLERLKRMAGFESQDFDPLVRSCTLWAGRTQPGRPMSASE